MPKSAKKRRSSSVQQQGIAPAAAGGCYKKPRSAATAPSSASNNNLIAPNTSLGQHFLKNPAVITAIVAKAGIKPTDTVLEIGPGTGNMTIPLLQQAKNVVALEYDSRMIREVLKRVEGEKLLSKKVTRHSGRCRQDAVALF